MRAFNKSKRIKSRTPIDRFDICRITYENCEVWDIPTKYIKYAVYDGVLSSLGIDMAKIKPRTSFSYMYENYDIMYGRIIEGLDITRVEFLSMKYNHNNYNVYERYCPKYIEDMPYHLMSDNILQTNETEYFKDGYSCRMIIRWDNSKDIKVEYGRYEMDKLIVSKEKYDQYKNKVKGYEIIIKEGE